MSSPRELTRKIEKYREQLEDEDKVGHALRRLQALDMTVSLLTSTGIGKAVNRLRVDAKWGKTATDVVDQWREVARKEGIKDSNRSAHENDLQEDIKPDIKIKREIKEEMIEKEPREKNYTNGHGHEETRENGKGHVRKAEKEEGDRKRSHHRGHESSSHESIDVKPITKKAKPAPVMDAFAAALQSGDSVKDARPKKMKAFDPYANIEKTYKPLPQSAGIAAMIQAASGTGPTSSQPAPSEEEIDPTAMFKPRKGQTKIFGGKKKGLVGLSQPLRLFDSCLRIISSHISVLESIPIFVPFDILKPVLEKLSPEQLLNVERKNPYLAEDSDELWEKHCKKKYPSGKSSKRETWKETWFRLEAETDNRLKRLSERITSTGSCAKQNTRQCTMIDQVKTPKNMRRRQERFGGPSTVIPTTMDMPHAIEVSRARKDIFDKGSKESFSTLPSSVRNMNSTLGSSSGVRKGKLVKTGALMKKTLKMMGKKSIR